MMKVVIADDEPLVQIGLKSMINWGSLDLEVCGTAGNGEDAWQLIQQFHPEIVITDIQMPLISGLELGRKCQEAFGRLPVFIILTSYEDFHYAQEAINFHAVDYLIKIDLSAESLTASVQKAIEQVRLLDPRAAEPNPQRPTLLMFQRSFYVRLLNHLFESEEQFRTQAKEFQIHLHAAGYAAAHIRFFPPAGQSKEDAASFQTYQRTIQMLQELLSKYMTCQMVALDTRYMAAILCLPEQQIGDWKTYARASLARTFQMLSGYYNVTFHVSIGRLVTDPLELSTSYYDARQLTDYLSAERPLLFWEEQQGAGHMRNVFNMYLFRSDIRKAFEELDEAALRNIFDNITALLSAKNVHFSQALDAAGTILHLAVALPDDGAKIVADIFADDPDSYQSLYRQKSVPDIIRWLRRLENGLFTAFAERRKAYGNALVNHCCQYIREHLHERIYLQSIADALSVSPNYLSQLFKKHMKVGMNEYITTQKINASKQLLRDTTMKVYEISDRLGFESSFYFSKVFKKSTGMSPKDYRSSQASQL